MDSLRKLAFELDVPERTLRRAARDGLIHGERISERGFRTSLREREYLRRNWPLLSGLREKLRTEPNVSLAVLYGSAATGRATSRSDVDLLIAARNADMRRLVDLSRRLSAAAERDVQLVRLEDAESSPRLILDVIGEGRVLVDREGEWNRLKSRRDQLAQRASAESDLADVASDLLDGD